VVRLSEPSCCRDREGDVRNWQDSSTVGVVGCFFVEFPTASAARPPMLAEKTYTDSRPADIRRRLKYIVELSSIAIIYVALAKLSLALASIHPSATPIWPPTGFALAIVLLLGYRITPAIFLGAFMANVTTAGSISTSLAIATGNALESLVGAYLINQWSDGCRTFDTPGGVTKFALIGVIPSTIISATLGVGSLSVASYADWSDFRSIWTTWWMGDLAGALVITPAIILWGTDPANVLSAIHALALENVLDKAVPGTRGLSIVRWGPAFLPGA
jgi:integral membrane sensor domain MASE1